MAVAFVDAMQDKVVDGGNVNLNLSGMTPSAGDLIVVVSGCFGRAGNEGRIGNALSYNSLIDTTATTRLRVAYKIFVPGETSMVIEGSGNASDATVATAIKITGHDATTPIDVTSTTASATSTNPNPAAITPASNNCGILIAAASGVNDGSPGSVTNYTNIVGGGESLSDTNPVSLWTARRILTGGAGASEDPGAWSTWGSGAWVAVTIAIRPAGVGGSSKFFFACREAFAGWRRGLTIPQRKLIAPRKPRLILPGIIPDLLPTY